MSWSQTTIGASFPKWSGWRHLMVLPWSLSLVKTLHNEKWKCTYTLIFLFYIYSHSHIMCCWNVFIERHDLKSWLSVSMKVTLELLTQKIAGSFSSQVWPQGLELTIVTRELLALHQFTSDTNVIGLKIEWMMQIKSNPKSLFISTIDVYYIDV